MCPLDNDLPTVSVVVPTHNRAPLLPRILDALCRQTYPPERMELVVVADGCTDSTLAALHAFRFPVTLHIIAQTQQGPAAARNNGGRHASGELLLFLDDDVEARTDLVDAHVQTHQRHPGAVVIGYYPPVLDEQAGLFRAALRRWWEEKFDAMRQPGHRFNAFDSMSGNFSISTDLFHRVGGFNVDLRVHEDYELGLRLIRHGVPFVFAAEAVGYHHEKSDLWRVFERKREEGIADVFIGRRYPSVRSLLPLFRLKPRSWHSRALFHLAFMWPAGGDLLASGGVVPLKLLDRVRTRTRWRRLLDELAGYWYWRGVAEAVSSRQEMARLQAPEALGGDGLVEEIDIDLRDGVPAAEALLDTIRPAGARLRYGPHPVGRIPSLPATEPLRGSHLRPILATDLAWPLLSALAKEGVIGPPLNVDDFLTP